MIRVAKVYVHNRLGLPPGIRALLDSNGIDYAEIDVADDAALLDWVREMARSLELPVVELDSGLIGVGASRYFALREGPGSCRVAFVFTPSRRWKVSRYRLDPNRQRSGGAA